MAYLCCSLNFWYTQQGPVLMGGSGQLHSNSSWQKADKGQRNNCLTFGDLSNHNQKKKKEEWHQNVHP